jgi:hypothetical protein
MSQTLNTLNKMKPTTTQPQGSPVSDWSAALSAAAKRSWANPEYRAKKSEITKAQWANPLYRSLKAKQSKDKWNDPVFRSNQIEKHRAKWADPAYRSLQSELKNKTWGDPNKRKAASDRLNKRLGNPDQRREIVKHVAKWWVLRSPQGRYYQIFNLRQWCKDNEHLFDRTCYAGKRPLWAGYAHGLGLLRGARGSYHGWTLAADYQCEASVFGSQENTDYPEQISR